MNTKLKRKIATVFLTGTLMCTCFFNVPTVANASIIQNSQINDEETFSDWNNKFISKDDKLISSKDIYYKISKDNASEPQAVTKQEFDKENAKVNNPNQIGGISVCGYDPDDPIDFPDKYDWINLRLNVYSLDEPIHGNKYRFSAGFFWKRQPFVVSCKDVFGIANDGNIVFDSSTFSGQAIYSDMSHRYGTVLDFDNSSSDCLEGVSGVAFKYKPRPDEFGLIAPNGFITVCGNNAADYGAVGVTYAHSQITGSFGISVNKGGPSLSVSPSISFDTVTQTAAIDF